MSDFKFGRASGSGDAANQFDTIDLDDIFTDYFFPEDLDFDAFRKTLGIDDNNPTNAVPYDSTISLQEQQQLQQQQQSHSQPYQHQQYQLQQQQQQQQPQYLGGYSSNEMNNMNNNGLINSISNNSLYQPPQSFAAVMSSSGSSNNNNNMNIYNNTNTNSRNLHNVNNNYNLVNHNHINNNNHTMHNNRPRSSTMEDSNIHPGSVIMIPPIPPRPSDSQMQGEGVGGKLGGKKDKKLGGSMITKKLTKQQLKLQEKQLAITTAATSSSGASSSSSSDLLSSPNKIVKQESAGSSSTIDQNQDNDDNDDGEYDDDDDDDDDDSKYKKSKKFAADGSGGIESLEDSFKVERRERNREHAKRSRVRKRLLLGTLQDRLSVLRQENVKLRRVVLEKVPHMATQIFDKCTTEESDLLTRGIDNANVNSLLSLGSGTGFSSSGNSGGSGQSIMYRPDSAQVNVDSLLNKEKTMTLPSLNTNSLLSSSSSASSSSSSSNNIHHTHSLVGTGVGITPNAVISSSSLPLNNGVRESRILMEPDFRLIQALQKSQHNFVLSDPSLPDNPIVYCSEGFCKLTGYKRQHILGRNCRFLQGPGTDQNAVDLIRQGVAVGADISVCLLNYKADGTPFWNQFFVAALRDSDGCIVNFVGVQCEVNIIPISALKDRVKKIKIPDEQK